MYMAEDEPSLFPRDVHAETAARAQSFKPIRSACARHGGQQFDFAGCDCRKHFGNAPRNRRSCRQSGTAGTSQNRFGNETTALAGGTQQPLEKKMRVIAVAETRPQIHPPGQRPTGAIVAARDKKPAAGAASSGVPRGVIS